MKYALIILVAFLAFGCKSTYPTATSTNTNTVTREVSRTVEAKTNADTATSIYSFNVNYNDEGQPVAILEKVSENKGSYTKAPTVKVEGNRLVITATAEPQTIPIEVKDTITETTTNKETTTIIEVNKLNVWQTVRIWLANILLIATGGFVVFRFLQIKGILTKKN